MHTNNEPLARLSITIHRTLGALGLGFVVAFVVVLNTNGLAQLAAWVGMVSTVIAFAILLYVSERLDLMLAEADPEPIPPPAPTRPHLYVVR